MQFTSLHRHREYCIRAATRIVGFTRLALSRHPEKKQTNAKGRQNRDTDRKRYRQPTDRKSQRHYISFMPALSLPPSLPPLASIAPTHVRSLPISSLMLSSIAPPEVALALGLRRITCSLSGRSALFHIRGRLPAPIGNSTWSETNRIDTKKSKFPHVDTIDWKVNRKQVDSLFVAARVVFVLAGHGLGELLLKITFGGWTRE